MPIDAAPSDADVRNALRSYLRERPEAADTPVGIRQWWLPERMRGISMQQLRLALADLVADGEIRRTILPDGTELYSRTGSGH